MDLAEIFASWVGFQKSSQTRWIINPTNYWPVTVLCSNSMDPYFLGIFGVLEKHGDLKYVNRLWILLCGNAADVYVCRVRMGNKCFFGKKKKTNKPCFDDALSTKECEVSQRIHHVWYCLMVNIIYIYILIYIYINIYIYICIISLYHISRIYPDISWYIQISDDNPAISLTSRQFCKVILAGLVAFTFYLGSSMGFRKRQHRQNFLLELSRLSWANGAGALEAVERPGVMGIYMCVWK